MAAAEGLPPVIAWLLYGRVDATGRCECRGECGRRHPRGECEADHPARLTAAPRDVSVPLTRAASLPVDELMLWCHSCRDGAEAAERRRRRERLAAEADASQLDLWGAA